MGQKRLEQILDQQKYTNANDILPQIIDDQDNKGITRIQDSYLIVINCFSLIHKVKKLWFHIEDTNIRNTQIFTQIQSSADQSLLACLLYIQKFQDHQLLFEDRLVFSRLMLKTVEDRSFYNAMTLHRQKVQKNGGQVLFYQSCSLFRLHELLMSLQFNGHWQIKVLVSLKQAYFQYAQCDFNLWWQTMFDANYYCYFFIDFMKEDIERRKSFLKGIFSNKVLSKGEILEILQFFIWMSKREWMYLQKIKENQTLINSQILSFYIKLKEIHLQQSYTDYYYQQYKSLVRKVSQKIQLIFEAVQMANKAYSGTRCQFDEYDYQSIFNSQDQKELQYQSILNNQDQKEINNQSILNNQDSKELYYKMSIYINKIINEQEYFLFELIELQNDCK